MQRDLADPRFHSCTPSHMRVPMVANESIEEQNSRVNYEAECDVAGCLPVRMPPGAAYAGAGAVMGEFECAVGHYMRRRFGRVCHKMLFGTQPAFLF